MYKIYVTEDDEVQAQLITDTLTTIGSVRVFSTALHLLDALVEQPCDIIILDIMLPRMSGLDALRKIRETDRSHNIPVLILSALQDKQQVVQGLDRGANDYVVKPFEPHQLRARVRSLLRQKQQNDNIESLLDDRNRLSKVAMEEVDVPLEMAADMLDFLCQDKRLAKTLMPFVQEVIFCIKAAVQGTATIRSVIDAGPIVLSARPYSLSDLIQAVHNAIRADLYYAESTTYVVGLQASAMVLIDPPQLMQALTIIARHLLEGATLGGRLVWFISESVPAKLLNITMLVRRHDHRDMNEFPCVTDPQDNDCSKVFATESASTYSQQLLAEYVNLMPGALYLVADREVPKYSVIYDHFADLSPNSAIELASKGDRLIISEKYNAACNAGLPYDHYYCLDSKRGRIWVRESGRPRNSSTGTEYFVAIWPVKLTDSTRPVALDGHELELFLRNYAALDASIGGLALLVDGRYIYANRSHCEMYGFSPEECIGQSWEMLYSAEEQHRIKTEIFPILERQKKWAGEVVGKRRDGSNVDVFISLNISGSGELICSCIDITERRQSERSLLESLEALRRANESAASLSEERMLLLNTSSEAILAYRADGLLEYANSTAEALFGFEFSHAQLLGGVIPSELAELLLLPNSIAFPAVKEQSFEAAIDDRNGVSTVYDVRRTSYIGKSNVLHHFAFIQDVTERTTAARAVEEARDSFRRLCLELLESSRHREHALATISHELRTPLANVITLTDLFLDGQYGAVSDVQRDRLSAVQKSSRHLYSLVQDTLDFAALAAGSVVLKVSRCKVQDLLEESVSLTTYRLAAKEQHLDLKFECPKTLYVNVDRQRIVQVLVNLLSNASKFSPRRASISIAIALRDESLEMIVTDTGIGISSPNLNRLFEPYYQVDGDLDRSIGGTGLGLALVRRIVVAHGGHVAISSQLGAGTEVRVVIPRHAGQNTPTKTLVPLSTAVSPRALDYRRCVVFGLGDTQDAIRLARYLSVCGFPNYLCECQEEFIASFEDANASCGFLVLNEDESSAIELLERLRGNTQAARVRVCIVSSAKLSGSHLPRLSVLAESALYEPYSVADLLTTAYALNAV